MSNSCTRRGAVIGDLGAFQRIGIFIIREAELSVLHNPVLFISRVDK